LRNLRCVISYDGSEYAGFQSQPGKNTIQVQIEEALFKVTNERIKIVSSGRTDAGVHARNQVINFHTLSRIPIHKWCLALNIKLPKDIVFLHVDEVPISFNARKYAKLKTYEYRIRLSSAPDVFNRKYELFHPTPLNINEMQQALSFIEGKHDFTSFCSVKTDKLDKLRHIERAWMEIENSNNKYDQHEVLVKIYFHGNGFLYNMVRIIVGTLIQIGEGKKVSTDMKRILEAKDRSAAGPTAAAHALSLWSVEYEDIQLFIN
jgi:tRNA pseudouridine38-40 synthase